jgi:signal transduction histidine kinase
MGLRIMEQRVALLKGSLKIASRQGLGSKIKVKIPWRARIDG